MIGAKLAGFLHKFNDFQLVFLSVSLSACSPVSLF